MTETSKKFLLRAFLSCASIAAIGSGMIIGVAGALIFILPSFSSFNAIAIMEGIAFFIAGCLICGIGFLILPLAIPDRGLEP